MEGESKSVNHQELKDSVCIYLKYCIKKQVPPPPTYSSEIYKEEIINEQYQIIESLIFNSDQSVDIISHLSFKYRHNIQMNGEMDKDYESRETIVPKNEFEKFLWDLVNNHFKVLTAEQLYPIPRHVIEAQKTKDSILDPIGLVFGFGMLLFWIWTIYGWIFN